MYNLIYPNQSNSVFATGMIDEHQILPTIIEEARLLPKKNLFQKQFLESFFWLLAIFLFAAERFITYQNKRGGING